MNRIHPISLAILLSITLLGPIAFSYGTDSNDEDYILGDVSSLSADFNLDVRVLSASGQELGTEMPKINKICIFRINESRSERNTDQSNFYDISFFLDNRFSRYTQKSADAVQP